MREEHQPASLPSNSKTIFRAYNHVRSDTTADINWELIEQYLPLVKGIVARMGIYFNTHIDMEDIYSVGVAGLIAAVQRFDPDKSKSFTAYAAMRVRGAILDELRRIDWMPRTVRASAKKLRKTIEDLEHSLQRAATEVEIRMALGLSADDYIKLLEQVRPLSFVAMDEIQSKDTVDGMSMHDRISDITELNAREKTENQEVVKMMKDRIETLPDLPRRILSMYYFEGMRLSEIADIFKLSEARICQIHTQTVISLRSYLDNLHIQNSDKNSRNLDNSSTSHGTHSNATGKRQRRSSSSINLPKTEKESL